MQNLLQVLMSLLILVLLTILMLLRTVTASRANAGPTARLTGAHWLDWHRPISPCCSPSSHTAHRSRAARRLIADRSARWLDSERRAPEGWSHELESATNQTKHLRLQKLSGHYMVGIIWFSMQVQMMMQNATMRGTFVNDNDVLKTHQIVRAHSALQRCHFGVAKRIQKVVISNRRTEVSDFI